MCRLTWSRERWFLFDRRRRMIVGMRRPARLGRDGVPAPSGCLVVILVALLRTPNLIPDRQDGVHALSRYPVCSHHDLLYSAGASHGHKSLRSEEHTSELQSRGHLVCRLLLAKKKH